MSDKIIRRFAKLSVEEKKITLDRLNDDFKSNLSTQKNSPIEKAITKPKNKPKIESDSETDSHETSKKSRRERKPRDPNAPKRAMTGYICYSKQRRTSAKEEYPNLKPRELTAKMAEEWNSMSDSQKAPFNEQSNVDKARYKAQKDNYKKND